MLTRVEQPSIEEVNIERLRGSKVSAQKLRTTKAYNKNNSTDQDKNAKRDRVRRPVLETGPQAVSKENMGSLNSTLKLSARVETTCKLVGFDYILGATSPRVETLELHTPQPRGRVATSGRGLGSSYISRS